MTRPPLLEIRDLTVTLEVGRARRPLVEGVDLAISAGRTLGLVGESGCGKSMTMLAIMGLLPARAIVGGSIALDGEELVGRGARAGRDSGKRVAMIFQDPMTALDPVMTVGEQIGEAIAIHDPSASRRIRRARARDLLSLVAIPFPERRLLQYPHELSGGMRQRVMIAIAMANNPELLIADEPTTALDVMVQAQILDLLRRLQQERRMGLILISHDLGLVAEIADEVAVMYAGRICERGPAAELFDSPRHPYTRGLIASLPRIDRTATQLAAIPGQLPSPGRRPGGCSFHPRCAFAQSRCAGEVPRLAPLGFSAVACHFPPGAGDGA